MWPVHKGWSHDTTCQDLIALRPLNAHGVRSVDRVWKLWLNSLLTVKQCDVRKCGTLLKMGWEMWMDVFFLTSITKLQSLLTICGSAWVREVRVFSWKSKALIVVRKFLNLQWRTIKLHLTTWERHEDIWTVRLSCGRKCSTSLIRTNLQPCHMLKLFNWRWQEWMQHHYIT